MISDLAVFLASRLYRVTKGLQYLHSIDIIHGTLKTVSEDSPPSTFIQLISRSGPSSESNILIDASGCVWLAYYGLLPFRKDRNPSGHGTSWGAPRVLVAGQALKPVDIFASVMLVIEVLTGKEPVGRPKVPFSLTRGSWKGKGHRGS